MDPTPVQVTAFPKVFPISIVKNSVNIKMVIPNPMLLINSDCMYSLTSGWNLGTKIIVTTVDKIHFVNEIKLNEKPFKKHCMMQ